VIETGASTKVINPSPTIDVTPSTDDAIIAAGLKRAPAQGRNWRTGSHLKTLRL
jgi:hypothetical protein